MKLRFGPFLCVLALLVQVAVGALPPGEFCFGCESKAPAKPACCCCGDEGAANAGAKSVCPMRQGKTSNPCDKCWRIQNCDRDGRLISQVRVHLADGPVIALLQVPAILLPGSADPRFAEWHSPPTESPPHLRLISTVCLIV